MRSSCVFIRKQPVHTELDVHAVALRIERSCSCASPLAQGTDVHIPLASQSRIEGASYFSSLVPQNPRRRSVLLGPPRLIPSGQCHARHARRHESGAGCIEEDGGGAGGGRFISGTLRWHKVAVLFCVTCTAARRRTADVHGRVRVGYDRRRRAASAGAGGGRARRPPPPDRPRLPAQRV